MGRKRRRNLTAEGVPPMRITQRRHQTWDILHLWMICPLKCLLLGHFPNWPYGKLPSWVPGAGWVYHEPNPLQFIYVV